MGLQSLKQESSVSPLGFLALHQKNGQPFTIYWSRSLTKLLYVSFRRAILWLQKRMSLHESVRSCRDAHAFHASLRCPHTRQRNEMPHVKIFTETSQTLGDRSLPLASRSNNAEGARRAAKVELSPVSSPSAVPSNQAGERRRR